MTPRNEPWPMEFQNPSSFNDEYLRTAMLREWKLSWRTVLWHAVVIAVFPFSASGFFLTMSYWNDKLGPIKDRTVACIFRKLNLLFYWWELDWFANLIELSDFAQPIMLVYVLVVIGDESKLGILLKEMADMVEFSWSDNFLVRFRRLWTEAIKTVFT